jgi:hypothetical protein
MPSVAGAAVGLGAAARFAAGARFGAAARFGVAVRFGVNARFGAAVGFGATACFDAVRFGSAGFRALAFRAPTFRAPTFRAPTFGAGARFLTAAVLGALGAADFARDGLPRDFLLGVALVRAGFFAPPCVAACAALAFLRACLAAFLLAFANFRALLSTAFASRTCRFAVSARARAFFAWARRRCAATDWFAPRS